MSNLFKVGDEVILKENFKDCESVYNRENSLAVIENMYKSVGVKLTIKKKHTDYPMLYKVNEVRGIASGYWFHENWFEYYEEPFELELEIGDFLV